MEPWAASKKKLSMVVPPAPVLDPRQRSLAPSVASITTVAKANTVAFISFRCRLTKVLAGIARGKKGSEGGGAVEAIEC